MLCDLVAKYCGCVRVFSSCVSVYLSGNALQPDASLLPLLGHASSSPAGLGFLQALVDYASHKRSTELQLLSFNTLTLLCRSGGRHAASAVVEGACGHADTAASAADVMMDADSEAGAVPFPSATVISASSTATTAGGAASDKSFAVRSVHSLSSYLGPAVSHLRAACLHVLERRQVHAAVREAVLNFIITAFEYQPAVAESLLKLAGSLREPRAHVGEPQDREFLCEDAPFDASSLLAPVLRYVYHSETFLETRPRELAKVYKILYSLWRAAPGQRCVRRSHPSSSHTTHGRGERREIDREKRDSQREEGERGRGR